MSPRRAIIWSIIFGPWSVVESANPTLPKIADDHRYATTRDTPSLARHSAARIAGCYAGGNRHDPVGLGWPTASGTIALIPIVLTSMMLILHPRIGGPATAALIANGGWGLMGFGLSFVVLHIAALQFGSAIALCLALAICLSWNLGLWWLGRRRVQRL